MQYCRGGDLRQVLDQAQHVLPVRDAVCCAATIADALGFAHSKGIVHRDVKPANVLLTDPPSPESKVDGLVRISDFGLVKEEHFDPDLTSDANVLATLGTPAYMSPEQTRGDTEVQSPSDVFSLGVMLYELLTGRHPFRKPTRAETFAAIRSTTPPPPSRHRGEIDRDLDAVVLKCLEKHADDRYASGMHVGQDLQRWLQGTPVLARRVGKLEQTVRWCRRNPSTSLPLCLAAISLILGTSVATWKWREAVRQREMAVAAGEEASAMRAAAEDSAADAEAMLQTMLESIGGLDPSRGGDSRLEAAVFLNLSRDQVHAKFQAPSPLKFRVLQAIAEAADGLGKYDFASRTWLEAHTLAEQLWGPHDLRALRCTARRADSLEGNGDQLASLELREDILAASRKHFGKDSPQFLNALSDVGMLQFDLGRTDLALVRFRSELDLSAEENAHQAAIAVCTRQVELLAESVAPDHRVLIGPLQRLASLYFQNGDRGRATATMRRAIEICKSNYGPDSMQTWDANASLAMMVRPAAAEPGTDMMMSTRSAASQKLSVDHPLMLRIDLAYGNCLAAAGNGRQAGQVWSEALDRSFARHGALHPETISLATCLARHQLRQSQPHAAIETIQRILSVLKEHVGPTHRGRSELEHQLAISLHQIGDSRQALEQLRHQVALMQQAYPAGHLLRQSRILSLALTLIDSREFAEAKRWIETWLDETDLDLRASRNQVRDVFISQLLCHVELGETEQAKGISDWLLVAPGRRPSENALVGSLRARCLIADGEIERGVELLRKHCRRLARNYQTLPKYQQSQAVVIIEGFREFLLQQGDRATADRVGDWLQALTPSAQDPSIESTEKDRPVSPPTASCGREVRRSNRPA